MGRPRVMVAEVALAAAVAPNVRSRCGLQKLAYRRRAIEVLTGDPRFCWLTQGPRGCILAELGRYEDAGLMRLAALRVCELRPPSEAGATMVRGWRLGRGKPDPLSLAERLKAAVRDYSAAHPGTGRQHLEDALDLVRRSIEVAASDDREEPSA